MKRRVGKECLLFLCVCFVFPAYFFFDHLSSFVKLSKASVGGGKGRG